MTQFAVFDEHGRVLYQGDVPESMIELQGDRVLVGPIDAATQYVLDGQATERPASPARLNGMRLDGLPQPCTIRINGTSYPCTADHCSLSFAYPGTYRILVEAFPYLDAAFEITV